MIKMLLLSNMYPSENSPGYGSFVKKFNDAMTSHGASVNRVVINSDERRKWRKLISYFFYFWAVWRALLSSRYDLVYVHYVAHSLLPVTFVRWMIRKPLVVNVHGSDVLPDRWLGRAIIKFNHKTILSADMIVVPSAYYKGVVEKMFPGSNVMISPSSGVDLERFRPEPSPSVVPREVSEGGSRVFRIGYVSRLARGKGWETFLEALAQYCKMSKEPKVLVDIVGGGEDYEKCQGNILRLGLESIVTLHGAVHHSELPSYFQKFDVFVFPSERRAESLGLVGLEAMACGCPVIGSNIPGIKSYLEDGINGLTFEPGDSQSLVEAIDKFMYLSGGEHLRMRANALSTAESYDSRLVNSALFECLKARYSKEVCL